MTIDTSARQAIATSGIPNSVISLGDILKPSTGGGRVVLPVDQSVPFAHFKHVAGVPSASPGTGYPLSKLQALDVLIDRLIALRKNQQVPELADPKGLSDAALDAMIRDLGQKVGMAMHQGLPALQESRGIDMGTASSHTGLILDALI